MTLFATISCVVLLAAAVPAIKDPAAALVLCAGSVASGLMSLQADLVALAVLGSGGVVLAGMVRIREVQEGGRMLGISMCALLTLVTAGPLLGDLIENVDGRTEVRAERMATIAGQAALRTEQVELPDMECAGASDREQCYRSLFKRRAEQSSPVKQAALLSQIVELYPQSDVVGYCHVASHDLGGMALRDTGKEPVEIFEDFADRYMASCSWGFSHGVWQQWFDNMETADIIDGIDKLCVENSTSGTLARAACVHILGHTVVQREPENYIRNLEKCLGMPEADDYVLCVNGGLMEHFGNPDLRVAIQGTGPEKALEPCLGVKDDFMRRSCISEAGPQLASAMSYDPKGMFETCDAQAGEFKEYCYQGIIRGGIGITTAMQVPEIEKACRDAGERYFEPCIRNAALMLSFNEADRNGADQLCAYLPEDRRQECSEAALAGVSLSQRDAE